jgi:uncharacterized protein YbcC (UPF0753/DUF2309 family)
MNACPSDFAARASRGAPVDAAPQALTTRSVQDAVTSACAKIAPLWPLKDFVAVNPFLGLTDRQFVAACDVLQRVGGHRTLMPRAWYRERIAQGEITDADLAAAIETATPGFTTPQSVAEVKRELDRVVTSHEATAVTFLECVDRERSMRLGPLAVDEISKWCASYWDRHQSVWRSPAQALAPYAAWRSAARHDRTPELLGCPGFRAAVLELPDEPLATIEGVLGRLGVPPAAIDDYLHRALLTINGWAAYAACQAWTARLQSEHDDTLVHLLAIRLAWEYAARSAFDDEMIDAAWRRALDRMALATVEESIDPDVALRSVLQVACEYAAQRRLLDRLDGAVQAPAATAPRKALQAAFCIDVRSEVYRRALESESAQIETRGFAGFFGLAFEYVPIGRDHGQAQCPVLLSPKAVVSETVSGSEARDSEVARQRRIEHDRASRLWRRFRGSAVSSFVYVETLGLAFAAKLAGSLLGWVRPAAEARTRGLSRAEARALRPQLSTMTDASTGDVIGIGARIEMAASLLSGMALTDGFARVVLLVGHGSSTVNNPHGAGLDCGACGGHSGASNAQLAAALLNDPEVRRGLAGKGIRVPDDTWFVAGLHDTTTDDVTLYDLDAAPTQFGAELRQIESWLSRASEHTRLERAQRLDVEPGAAAHARIVARSRDWSQVRPEWGLAGCSAFIAAPRSRTAGVDLAGRAFLHEYDWRSDTELGILELIMSAPMVVASWISLQYYGSVVDNAAYGSGNKVLHNVVAGLGVLEGNGGDLRVGLPWQSVHDGRTLMHEPLRLTVCIAAPVAAMNEVIARNADVRRLVDNGWVHLLAMPTGDSPWQRYAGDLEWRAIPRAEAIQAGAAATAPRHVHVA